MSSLDKYFQECFSRQEIFEDELLVLENIEQIHNALKGWTVEKWHQWRIDNAKLIYEFFVAPPSKQKSLKKFRDSYWLLKYAQRYIYEEARLSLSIASELEAYQGLSYQQMCAKASQILREVCQEQTLEDWTLDMPSPFV